MIRAVALGLRLAGGGAGSGRLRSAMVAAASAIGTWLLLSVAAIARAEQRQNVGLYASAEMQRLLLAVVLAIALPVLVLAATAGRLSAALRERRLANLRLLGMTPAQTRIVAVAEAGVAAVVGAAAGLVAFLLTRPLLGRLSVAGRDWTVDSLEPHVSDYVFAVVLVPLVVVALAALPARVNMTSALSSARKAETRRPSWWRTMPLAIGVVLCGYVISQQSPNDPPGPVMLSMFAGITLLGVGAMLVIPIFVRLVADLMLRHSRGPATLIAGRRLQAQPAAVTRVIGGLLLGLFLVTGARSVVVAFESTPQYISSASQIDDEQRVTVRAKSGAADSVIARAERIDGVRHAVAFSELTHGCTSAAGSCLNALVSTCADLQLLAPTLTGCRDDRTLWLDSDPGDAAGMPAAMRWRADREGSRLAPITLPTPTARIDGGNADNALSPHSPAAVFVPRDILGDAAVVTLARVSVLVVADPGRDLADTLSANGLGADSFSDFENYDFVAGLRAMVWAIAAVILSVGLLAFAVAAIDRALGRRREVVSLQLIGVSPGLLRRTQWIEAALPIAAGTLLAIGLGLLAGATFLSIGDSAQHSPWQQSLTLGVVSVLSAFVIAGLTVLAASPRIRPDLIRAE